MKIAILGSRGFPSTYGGYETLVRYLAPYIAEAGHEVTVYTRNSSRRGESSVEGVRCIASFGWDSKALSTLSFGFTGALDACFRGFDAMLVLNIANGFWLPLVRVSRTPTVVNTDGIEWERGKWGPIAQGLFRLGARLTSSQATELICDSVEMGRIWSELFNRPSIYIPYGAPVLSNVADDRLGEFGLDGKRYLLSVARLVPENNVDLTLDALNYLNDPDLLAVFVGDSVGQSVLAERLGRLRDAGKIVWLGHVADQELLTQLWGNCVAYVHGHSVGGTNPALLQALGAGAPTLALDTPFNAEVLGGSRQLYAHSPTDLASRIKALCSDEEYRSRISSRGKALVRERYSWDDVCRRYLEVLEGISSS